MTDKTTVEKSALPADLSPPPAQQEIDRLKRYIATFPARPWLETDHPDVVACMGSVPACAENGCQARRLSPPPASVQQLIEKWREIAATANEARKVAHERYLVSKDLQDYLTECAQESLWHHYSCCADELAALYAPQESEK